MAVAKNGAIGKNNDLPWELSDDLKLFKKRTLDHVIIMGRKTYESIGKPLPRRINIVISRNKELTYEGCHVVHSLEEALSLAGELSDKQEIFIIGGQKIFNLSRTFATRLYLTKVDTDIEDADTFFDLTPFKDWSVIDRISYSKSEKNQYDFEVLEMIPAV